MNVRNILKKKFFGKVIPSKDDPFSWMFNWGTLLVRAPFQGSMSRVVFWFHVVTLYLMAMFTYSNKPPAILLLEYLSVASLILVALSLKASIPYYGFAIILLVLVWVGSEMGERIRQECEIIFLTATQLNWTNWNKSNRQMLLMFLVITQQPLEINCYGFFKMNREALLKVSRLIHVFLTWYKSCAN
uniref:Uncharacterized protein LOC114327099 n=1 Tax=Diabrotica virgifera virgifera TaxID=50390 RepID=A0A6P7FDG4_DIAVI